MSRIRDCWICVVLVATAACHAHAGWLSSAIDMSKVLVKHSDQLESLYGGLRDAVRSRDAALAKELDEDSNGIAAFDTVFKVVGKMLPLLVPAILDDDPDDPDTTTVTERGAFTSIPVGRAPTGGYYPGLYADLADIMAANRIPTFLNISVLGAPVMVKMPSSHPRVYANNGPENITLDVVELVAQGITGALFRGNGTWPTGIQSAQPVELTLLNGTEGKGQLLLKVDHDFAIVAPLESNKSASCISGLRFKLSDKVVQRPFFVPLQTWNDVVPASGQQPRSMLGVPDSGATNGVGFWRTVVNVKLRTTSGIDQVVDSMLAAVRASAGTSKVAAQATAVGTTITFTVKTPLAGANVQQVLFDAGMEAMIKIPDNGIVDVQPGNSDWTLSL